MKEKTIYVDVIRYDHTGYTLALSGNVGTGQVGGFASEPMQGMPQPLLPLEEDLPQSIFPETREERFLDDNLLEFYRKKGL